VPVTSCEPCGECESLPRSNAKRWLGSAVKAVLLLLVLYFVGRELMARIRLLEWAELRLQPLFLALAALSYAGTLVFQGLAFHALLGRFGASVSPPVAFAIIWISQLGKYIPGKIAVVGGAVVLLRRYGVRTSVSTLVCLVIYALILVVGFLMALPLLRSEEVMAFVPIPLPVLALMVGVGALALWPRVLVGVGNHTLRRAGRPPLTEGIPRAMAMALPIACTVCQCFAVGLAAWCVACAFEIQPVSLVPLTVSAASLGWALGLAAIFAPAGVGIREGGYLLALSPAMGPEAAALVAVGVRLVQVVVDIAMGLAGLAILRAGPPESSQP
jgi:glycosyltransferase 2 family protein